jgi:hypothetical protein
MRFPGIAGLHARALGKIAPHALPDRRLFLPAHPAPPRPARRRRARPGVHPRAGGARHARPAPQRGPRARALVRRRRLPAPPARRGRPRARPRPLPAGRAGDRLLRLPRARAVRHHHRQPALCALPGHRREHPGADRARRLRGPAWTGAPTSTCSSSTSACATCAGRRADLHHPARLPQGDLGGEAQPPAGRGRLDHRRDRARRCARVPRRGAELPDLALREGAQRARDALLRDRRRRRPRRRRWRRRPGRRATSSSAAAT